MEGTPEQGQIYKLKPIAPARPAVARGGDNHTRTAGAPAAAAKLVRRTFLGDHTGTNSLTSINDGNTWSIKIHDYGKQWVEGSWGKVDARPGKRGSKGKSRNKEQNEQRACARARSEIRRKCLAIAADHLVTLTYRDNVENRERVLTDLERLRRMLSRAGYSMPYVAVVRNHAKLIPLVSRQFDPSPSTRRETDECSGQPQGARTFSAGSKPSGGGADAEGRRGT